MQVVYLGSSPATQRRYGSPRLMRPVSAGSLGYNRPASCPSHHGPLYAQRSVDSHSSYTNQTSKQGKGSDTKLRDSIPAMAKPVAIFCLVLNIICPGLGTFISACALFCCAIVRPSKASRYRVFFLNVGVALLQFVTAFIFLLGWIWSIMWGAAFLEISDSHYKRDSEDSKTQANNVIVKRPNDLKLKTKNNNLQSVKNDLKLNSPTIVLHEVPLTETRETDAQVACESQKLVEAGKSLSSSDHRQKNSSKRPVSGDSINMVFTA